MTKMVSLQGLWAVYVGKEMNEAFGKNVFFNSNGIRQSLKTFLETWSYLTSWSIQSCKK